jgi:hypothetical protein
MGGLYQVKFLNLTDHKIIDRNEIQFSGHRTLVKRCQVPPWVRHRMEQIFN